MDQLAAQKDCGYPGTNQGYPAQNIPDFRCSAAAGFADLIGAAQGQDNP